MQGMAITNFILSQLIALNLLLPSAIGSDEDETLDENIDETLCEMLSEIENPSGDSPSVDEIQEALDRMFEDRLLQDCYMAYSVPVCAPSALATEPPAHNALFPELIYENTLPCCSRSDPSVKRAVFISGKHKGKTLSEVPRTYIKWLQNHGF